METTYNIHHDLMHEQIHATWMIIRSMHKTQGGHERLGAVHWWRSGIKKQHRTKTGKNLASGPACLCRSQQIRSFLAVLPQLICHSLHSVSGELYQCISAIMQGKVPGGRSSGGGSKDTSWNLQGKGSTRCSESCYLQGIIIKEDWGSLGLLVLFPDSLLRVGRCLQVDCAQVMEAFRQVGHTVPGNARQTVWLQWISDSFMSRLWIVICKGLCVDTDPCRQALCMSC